MRKQYRYIDKYLAAMKSAFISVAVELINHVPTTRQTAETWRRVYEDKELGTLLMSASEDECDALALNRAAILKT